MGEKNVVADIHTQSQWCDCVCMSAIGNKKIGAETTLEKTTANYFVLPTEHWERHLYLPLHVSHFPIRAHVHSVISKVNNEHFEWPLIISMPVLGLSSSDGEIQIHSWVVCFWFVFPLGLALAFSYLHMSIKIFITDQLSSPHLAWKLAHHLMLLCLWLIQDCRQASLFCTLFYSEATLL